MSVFDHDPTFLYGHGWWIGALILGLLKIVFFVAVIVLLARLLRSGADASREQRSPALSVLEERYARGEITREEFLERRSVLEG